MCATSLPDAPGAREPYPWEAQYPTGVAWDADIPCRRIESLLDEAAAQHPNRACLDFLGKGYNYGQIATLVARAAHGFRKLGVRPGVKVALLLPNSPYAVISYFAVLKAGGTVVNCNPLSAAPEFIGQVADAEAEIIVTLDVSVLYEKVAAALVETTIRHVIICPMADALTFLKATMFRIGHWRQRAHVPRDSRHLLINELIAQEPLAPVNGVNPGQEVAVIQYTGGTTGDPKGVMLTHENVYANTRQITLWFTQARPDAERVLAILPFSHSFGMTAVMNFALSLSAELVILPRFDLTEMLDTIDRRRVTMLIGVPTLFHAINEFPKLARYDLSSLKVAVSGGDTLPLAVQQRFVSLTGCELAEGYGLTECAPVVTCSNPLAGIARPGSCGLPVPRTIVEIVSIDDQKTVLPSGELGEICVRGPQVMLGYWKQPMATRDCMPSGRLRTGDVGRMDEDGYLYFADRLKEVIVVHGYKVYPRLVEDAIRAHPAVAEAAVVGVADEIRGHAPKAYVVCREDGALTAETLRSFLSHHLSPAEVPREIEFRQVLPKSTAGKILKRSLTSD